MSVKKSDRIPPRLIVNADDLGMTKGINEGIGRAFQKGIVRSASLLASGEAFEDALRLCREHPGLDIGIHLCLTELRPVLPASQIGTLLDGRNGFFKTHCAFFLHYLVKGIDLTEARSELEAQVEKVTDTGITPTHLDSHGYIHLLPGILRIAVSIAERLGIKTIRYPAESVYPCGNHCARIPKWIILRLLCACMQADRRNRGYFRVQGFRGFLSRERLSRQELERIFSTLPEGVCELVCHPGTVNNEVIGHHYWKYRRADELRGLGSFTPQGVRGRYGIEVVNFRELL